MYREKPCEYADLAEDFKSIEHELQGYYSTPPLPSPSLLHAATENGLGDAGATELAKALQANTSLTFLGLWSESSV
jgi:hypothetical protein